MRERRWVNLAFLVCWLGGLGLLLIGTVGRPWATWSYYENRTLKGLPPLTLEGVLDGTFMNGVEPALQDHGAGRNTLLQLETWLDLYLLHRPVVHEVVPTDTMLLGYHPYETVNPEEIQQRAEEMAHRLSRLQSLVEGYGGKFCYVAVPGQYAYFQEEYPPFLNARKEYTQVELAHFNQAMADQGVPWVDMGQVFQSMGNPPELYSTIDYHYQWEGAYVTYRTLMDRIQRELGVELTQLEGDNLEVQILEQPYLGSRARKVFGLWRNGETLEIGLPTQPIPFTRWDDQKEVSPQVYTLPQAWEKEVLYSVYMGGDVGKTVIQTHRPQLPTLLIYGDSFTNPVEGLMYYSFDQMISIDLRHETAETLVQTIMEVKPDFVVGIRDYEVLLSLDGNGNPMGD